MKLLPSLLLTTVFLSNLTQEPPSKSIKDKKQKKQKLPILIDEFRWNTNSYKNDFFLNIILNKICNSNDMYCVVFARCVDNSYSKKVEIPQDKKIDILSIIDQLCLSCREKNNHIENKKGST